MYSAKKVGTNYEIYQNGQRVSTGGSGILGNYGLSETNLGGGTATTGTAVSQPVSTPTAQQTSTTPPLTTPQSQPTETTGSVGQTVAPPPQTPTIAPAQTSSLPQTNSVVDLLNAAGQASDFQSRTQLAGQFGIKGYTGTAQQNQELAKKFRDFYESKKSSQAPDTGGAARTEMQTGMQKAPEQQDAQQTFLDQYMNLNPFVKSMYDSINQVLSPTSTQQTFVQEYQSLLQAQGIPGLQTDLMNIQNVMSGTEDDIRTEITKAGGFATESQVQAMTSARNKTLLKQASALSTTLQMKEDYVNQIMQFSQMDRAEAEKQVEHKLGLVEKLATMTDTMNKSAASNYNKIVDNLGYTGLAEATATDPQTRAYAESLLGLPMGALSNQEWLQQAQTYKQQQLAMAQQKINITVAGGANGIPSGATDAQVQYYLKTGNLPAFGYGATGQAARSAFWNAVALAESGGQSIVSDAQMNKATLSSLNKALGTQQNQYSATKTSIDTFDKQLTLLESMSAQVDRVGSPLVNKYKLWLKGEIQGDADTAAYQNIVKTASTEFAKIMSGSAASISGVTVSSAADAEKLINSNLNKEQITKVVQQMKLEGQFRLTSQQESINDIKNQISQIGVSNTKGTMTDAQWIERAVQDSGKSYTSIVNNAPKGQIPVVSNSTGEVGYLPVEEFNSQQYTKL